MNNRILYGDEPLWSQGYLETMPDDVREYFVRKKKYRIVSRADVPERMSDTYPFDVAHQMCCEWNAHHDATHMCWPEVT